MTIYAGLEKNPLVTEDKKIPFQWVQAGNTGNTGGGSPKPHGTSTWTPGADGTVISVDPKPNYDNFFFYSVLPYPAAPPPRLRAIAGNYAAASPAAWASSQQIEGPQMEYLGGGFKYTFCWSVNPHTGLQLWTGQKWQALPFGIAINSLAQPTFWLAEFSLDTARHICRYENVVVNDFAVVVGLEFPAVAIPASRKEMSIAVQLDGNKSGDAYAANLQNLVVEWE